MSVKYKLFFTACTGTLTSWPRPWPPVPGKWMAQKYLYTRFPSWFPKKYCKERSREARASFAHIPYATPEQLAEADAIIFGTPTRFGNMCAQMRNFLDQTGGLWMAGALIGKVGSVFTSTASQHGGNETTITSFHTTLLHHGMIVVGVPYSEQRLLNMEEISGGTPYGASTLTSGDGSRQPSENELAIARSQGRHVAEITKALVLGRQAMKESG
jgi:NAD(P)H:quinone oxidoreductase type IV